jgi:hypothetical protein
MNQIDILAFGEIQDFKATTFQVLGLEEKKECILGRGLVCILPRLIPSDQLTNDLAGAIAVQLGAIHKRKSNPAVLVVG